MPPILTLLLILSFIQSAPANAEIYRYTDEKGVASYTDDPGSIPPKFRERAVIVKPEDLPPLLVLPESGRPARKPLLSRWIDSVSSKLAIALAVLAASTWLVARTGAGGVLLRMAVKLLFIALIGAAAASFLMVRGSGPLSPSSDRGPAPSARPPASPIERANEAARQLETGEGRKSESLDAIVREQGPDRR